MHNAAFAALDADYVYLPFPVSPERLGDALRGLPALGFCGSNVTIPHKEAVVPFLTGASETVRAIGSANTLVVRPDGSLWGDSTDGPGFLADLRARGIATQGRHALVLGAGGAARAVAYALLTTGAVVSVANRSPERAEALCADMRKALPAADVSAHASPGDLVALAASSDLIINTTSLGLHPETDELPWDRAVPFRRGQVVYDLIYPAQAHAHERTPFLALAAEAGAIAIDGLGMLVWQGALSSAMWTGREAPVDVMWQAVSN
jgi:shikimate dehydrogenase